MDIKEEIHALSEEMLTNLGRLVAIDSQLGTPSEGKPFGEGPAKALEEGLKIAEELGFKTVNLDNYCGYAEMGEGDEIVGIAGHLDIVPVGGDWTYDPFRLTREDDHVYGRGTTDDKGPILEALYAMKLLRDHALVLEAQKAGVPIISCMGAGNKLDPSRFRVADIYKTQGCPLARVMRTALRKRGVKKLKVVYSDEIPTRPIEDMSISCRSHCICPPGAKHTCTERRDIPGSTAFVPSVAGLIIAGEVVKDLSRA